MASCTLWLIFTGMSLRIPKCNFQSDRLRFALRGVTWWTIAILKRSLTTRGTCGHLVFVLVFVDPRHPNVAHALCNLVTVQIIHYQAQEWDSLQRDTTWRPLSCPSCTPFHWRDKTLDPAEHLHPPILQQPCNSSATRLISLNITQRPATYNCHLLVFCYAPALKEALAYLVNRKHELLLSCT